MDDKNELTARDGLMTQMSMAHEQIIELLSKEDISDDDLKKARELNRMYTECYDRMAKEDEVNEELYLKHQQFEHEIEQAKKEAEAEKERKIEEAKKEKKEFIFDIVKIGITGVIVPVTVAYFTGRHADKIALAESVSMIGTKEAFRQTENAFKDSLKNVGKVI